MNQRIEEELFPFYALDALTPAERAEVEAYIRQYPEARARLQEYVESAQVLPQHVEPITPPAAVKQNLMARVQADSRARQAGETTGTTATATTPPPRPVVPSRKQRPSWWESLRQGWRQFQTSPALPALTAVALLILIFVIPQLISLNRQVTFLEEQVTLLAQDADNMEAELSTLRVQNQELREQIETQRDILATYREPGALTIAIGDVSGENPNASGTLTLAPETETAVFVANNLEQLDESQVYQLWLIRGETPISAGTFSVDESGTARLPVVGVTPGSFDAVGVSVEPQGGSEQPTQDQIILLGTAS